MTYYRQCRLRREPCKGCTRTSQIAFIPEPFTKVGKVLRIKEDDGTWEDGWEVVTVGGTRVDADLLSERSREYLRHRSVTDI